MKGGVKQGDSPTGPKVNSLRAKMEAEVGRLVRQGNVKVKKSQIDALLRREVVDMMRLRFGSDVTSLLSGARGLAIASRGKHSQPSASLASATQVNFQPGIIGRDLDVENVDLDDEESGGFDDIVIDLQDLDKMLYRADSQSTLQPPHDALIGPDSPFKGDAVSDRGVKEKAKSKK